MGALACLIFMLVLAIVFSPLYLLNKRHAEQAEQFLALLIGLGRSNKDHFHAADLFHLIVLDFGEDQLLADAQGVVAAAVEGLVAYAAEVAQTGQSDLHKYNYSYVPGEETKTHRGQETSSRPHTG